MSDLRPIEGLVNLDTLYLGWTLVSDINPLKSLEKLEYLTLNNCKQLIDISSLVGLDYLLGVNLNVTKIKDLSALKQLPTLKSLSYESNEITDIHELDGLTNLETLSLRGN